MQPESVSGISRDEDEMKEMKIPAGAELLEERVNPLTGTSVTQKKFSAPEVPATSLTTAILMDKLGYFMKLLDEL